MFKVGDKVKVTNWGEQYSTNWPFFKDYCYDMPIEYLVRYAYGDSGHYEGKKRTDQTRYVVLFTARMDGGPNDGKQLALITRDSKIGNSPIYLIDQEALEYYCA